MISDVLLNQRNLFSLYRRIGGLWRGEFYEEELYSIVKHSNSSWPNLAFITSSIGIGLDTVEGILQDLRNARMNPLVLGSANHEAALRAKGFIPADRTTGMSLKDFSVSNAICAGDRVAEFVEGSLDLPEWTSLVSQCLFSSRKLDSNIFNELGMNSSRLIGLKVRGELVGASMLYFDEDGNAGIYMVCVKKEYRAQGFGKTLLIHCLRILNGLKIESCYLQSTRIGKPLYLSLGFKETSSYILYTKTE